MYQKMEENLCNYGVDKNYQATKKNPIHTENIDKMDFIKMEAFAIWKIL